MLKTIGRRTVAFLLIGWLLLPFFSAAAKESVISEEERGILEEQMELSGANDLLDEIPEDADELLRENGIDSIDPDKLIGFSVGDFFQNLWKIVKKELTLPIRITLTVLAVILLGSLFQAFRATVEERGYTRVFDVVSVLALCGTVLAPVSECITRSANAIKECSEFILAFIPVFTGVVAASGKPITAAGYTTVMFGTVQIVSQIAATVLVPLLGVFLAFCVAGSVNSQININGLIATVKKVVIWTLGFLMTVLIGLMTVKGLVAGSADTVATKTAKFLIGSFVPVVGGALSEAFNSVQGCMGLIRGTVGSLGIIISFLTFLPVLITILLLMASLHLSAGLADVMSVEKVGELLRAMASVLSLLLGILLIFAVLLIVSVTVMLLLGMG